MRVRAYTLNVHVGHAPCWMFDSTQECEILTLANCKPLIRNAAKCGEWIAGITPTRMQCQLAYLMRIEEPITRIEYWKTYRQTRHDSIYAPKDGGGWTPLKNPWHTDEESCKRDLSSDYVLWSKNFYLFANSYTKNSTNPDGLPLGRYPELAKGGMRARGHWINLPDSFLSWVRKQPCLKLRDFVVLREFGNQSCGCCDEDEESINESAACGL